jgi:organic radical activating enzyme
VASIKVSELFYSIQGEGRYMGVPSIFLRTFGCNFKCAGFGMPKGELSVEADKVAEKRIDFVRYDQLPLVSTGCDSYASWHPAFKNLSHVLSVNEISENMNTLLPYKEWRDEHLVLTGGEPLLGWQRAYPELLDLQNMQKLRELTFETNGTQPLTDDLREYLIFWTCRQKRAGRESITFSVSAKLSCSGEKHEDAIKPDIVCDYETVGHTYLKFVVSQNDDVAEALDCISEYRNAGFTGSIYLMPVGGVESVYTLNNKRVAELAMKYGLRYSDRLQVPLFKNKWGT